VSRVAGAEGAKVQGTGGAKAQAGGAAILVGYDAGVGIYGFIII